MKKKFSLFNLFIVLMFMGVVLFSGYGIGVTARNVLNGFLQPAGSASKDNILQIGGTMNALSGSTVSFGGTVSFDEPITRTPTVTQVTEGVTSQILPVSGFNVLHSSENVTLSVASGVASISTETFTNGDSITITSSGTAIIQYPVGEDHFVVGSSSPAMINEWDSLTYDFYNSFWIERSSSTND